MAPMIVLRVPREQPKPAASTATAKGKGKARASTSAGSALAKPGADASEKATAAKGKSKGAAAPASGKAGATHARSASLGKPALRQRQGASSKSPISLATTASDEEEDGSDQGVSRRRRSHSLAETAATSSSGLPLRGQARRRGSVTRTTSRPASKRFSKAAADSDSDSSLTQIPTDAPSADADTSLDTDSSRTTPPSDGLRGKAAASRAPARKGAKAKRADLTDDEDESEGELSPAEETRDERDEDVAIPAFGRLSSNPARDLGRLFEAVQSARRVTVICGAGISVSAPANIPDFRSSEGLFKKLKDQHPNAGLSSGKDLFDARLFQSDATTGLFHSMIAELKRMADVAQPTSFHHMLKMLDEQGRLMRVYTQNIDGLEARAGLSFGLGENVDSSALKPVRAAGAKRKRTAASKNPNALAAMEHAVRAPSKAAPPVAADSLAGRRSWVRSQSDSALLWADSISAATSSSNPSSDALDAEPPAPPPMFPRCIPLHGSLHTLSCGVCAFKLDISPDHGSLDGSSSASPPPNLGATVSKPSDALELLLQGEPIPCPRCEVADEVRTCNGMRSRGIGLMKVDVVLYGGQNNSAERVGECISRDILGLRDPNEKAVPESARETQARERREAKVAAQAVKKQPLAPSADANVEPSQPPPAIKDGEKKVTLQSKVEVIELDDTASSENQSRASTPEKPLAKRRFQPSISEGPNAFRNGLQRFTDRKDSIAKPRVQVEPVRRERSDEEDEPFRYSATPPPVLSIDSIPESEGSRDSILAAHFGFPEDAADESSGDEIVFLGQTSKPEPVMSPPRPPAVKSASADAIPPAVASAPASTATLPAAAVSPTKGAARPALKKKASAKLKPLPPDLLIVAGTSLKVPGTKRIVREFAKACRARDRRVYPSDEEEEEEELGRGARRKSRSKAQQESSEDDDSEEEEDPKAPIRTVLVNYDFPIPNKEWEGVFDVWLQGDVQTAARGLAPTELSSLDSGLTLTDRFRLSEHFRGESAPTEEDSWIRYKIELDELRRSERRQKGRKSTDAPDASKASAKDKPAARTSLGKGSASSSPAKAKASPAKKAPAPSNSKSPSPAKKSHSSASASPKTKNAAAKAPQAKQAAKQKAKVQTTKGKAADAAAASKAEAKPQGNKLTNMLRAGVSTVKKTYTSKAKGS